MKFKIAGFILVVIGIIMIAYTGFSYITKDKVVDLGPIEINAKTRHPVQWSPIVGAVLLVGGIVVIVTSKKTNT